MEFHRKFLLKKFLLIRFFFLLLVAVLVFMGMKGCVLSPYSSIEGEKDQEGITGKSVSTEEDFPTKDGINGEKPKEAPIGREEGVDKLKENPVPSEGPGEEDKAEEN